MANIAERDRGVGDSKADQQAIRAMAEELASVSKPRGSLSGRWKLLWTTEQESLFILKYASLFNTKAGEVYQVIDTTSARLQNVITFPPDGMFLVDSSLQQESDIRCSFRFNAATLKLPNDREIKLPPFGQGWFESIYLDSDLRIASDSRGDLLIVARDGPPRMF